MKVKVRKIKKWKFNKARFIEILRRTGDLQHAAAQCRVNKKTPFYHRWHHPDFALQWKEAVEQYDREHPFVYKKRVSKSGKRIPWKMQLAALLKERTSWYFKPRNFVSYGSSYFVCWSVVGTRPNKYGRRSKIVFSSEHTMQTCIKKGFVLSWEGKQIKVIANVKVMTCLHDFHTGRKDICFICGSPSTTSSSAVVPSVESPTPPPKLPDPPTP